MDRKALEEEAARKSDSALFSRGAHLAWLVKEGKADDWIRLQLEVYREEWKRRRALPGPPPGS